MVNIGSLDRTLRFVVGAVLLVAVFVPPLAGWVAPLGAWKYALTAWGADGYRRWQVALGGGIPVWTESAMRFCPAYTLLGLNTCGMRQP